MRLRAFMQSGVGRYLGFLLFFGLLFVVLQGLYLSLPEPADRALNMHLNARPSALLLDLLYPVHAPEAVGTELCGHGVTLDVRKGCEGFEVMAGLAAALLAYPAPWRLRLAGLAAGLLYVYLLNLARIITIYIVAVSRPAWAQAAHVTIGQTAIIFLTLLFLLVWIEGIAPPLNSGQEEAEKS